MRYRCKHRTLRIRISNSLEMLKEILNILSHHSNSNTKKMWDSILYISEWLRSNPQMTVHAAEDAEQGEDSSFTDGSTNLHNHFGDKYGSFSEYLESIYLKINIFFDQDINFFYLVFNPWHYLVCLWILLMRLASEFYVPEYVYILFTIIPRFKSSLIIQHPFGSLSLFFLSYHWWFLFS